MDDETRDALEQINTRLDYIEDHILAMSQGGARQIYVPMGRSDHTPTDPGHVPEEVVALAQAGKRKDAIVRYRALTGASAEQAIAVVDGL